NRPVYIPPPP
nr:Chain B, Apidaecin [Bombus pascuorum]